MARGAARQRHGRRVFSTDLLALGDVELQAACRPWRPDAMPARSAGWARFTPTSSAARQVLGSGLRSMASLRGRRRVVDLRRHRAGQPRGDPRIAGLSRLDARVRFHLIGDDLSFASLGSDYDWVFGSIHHVPFEMGAARGARGAGSSEAAAAGVPSWSIRASAGCARALRLFEQWGKLTIRRRAHGRMARRRESAPTPVSAPLRTVLDFGFRAQNYRWLDLRYAGERPFRLADFDLAALSASCDLPPRSRSFAAGRSSPWRGNNFSRPTVCLPAPPASISPGPCSASGTSRALPSISRSASRAGRSGSAWSPPTRPICRPPRPWSTPAIRGWWPRAVGATRLVFRNLRLGQRSAFRCCQRSCVRPRDVQTSARRTKSLIDISRRADRPRPPRTFAGVEHAGECAAQHLAPLRRRRR